MRALVCKEFAPYDQLAVEEVPEPPLAEGFVMVDVKAAGVNFPDILLVEGKYQMKPPTPFVPAWRSRASSQSLATTSRA
jgi:NADPH2:quinone reductase